MVFLFNMHADKAWKEVVKGRGGRGVEGFRKVENNDQSLYQNRQSYPCDLVTFSSCYILDTNECAFDTWKNIFLYCRHVFRRNLRHLQGALHQKLKLSRE